MRGTVALLLVVLTTLAGCAGAPEPAAIEPAGPDPGWTTFDDGLHGLTVSFPSDWHRASESLTPALTDPREVLTLATFPLRGGPAHRCAHVPEQALRDLGPHDVLLTIQERHDPQGMAAVPPALGPAEPGDFSVCVHREGEFEEHWSEFTLGGRGFYLFGGFGRDVAPQRRAQVERILQSLDARPLEVHGDIAVVPPAGWTVVREPLTGFRELAVASFRVPDGPPDGNCTPRRALDAMPPGGALLYAIIEPDGHGEDAFRPTGERVLREPEQPYECMGLSRRASWTEHGHPVLANLYLGPEATAQRRAELEQAFDSLVVRK